MRKIRLSCSAYSLLYHHFFFFLTCIHIFFSAALIPQQRPSIYAAAIQIAWTVKRNKGDTGSILYEETVWRCMTRGIHGENGPERQFISRSATFRGQSGQRARGGWFVSRPTAKRRLVPATHGGCRRRAGLVLYAPVAQHS